LNFRKANHLTEWDEIERKFPGKYVRKFGYTSRGCLLRSQIMQIRNFLFSDGSFGRDHRELDISRKDDRQRPEFEN